MMNSVNCITKLFQNSWPERFVWRVQCMLSPLQSKQRSTEIHTNSTFCKDESTPGKPPEFDGWPGKEYTNEWVVKQKGKIYDKKPFKFRCEKGKEYKWCACGLSKNQPFCDDSHNGPLLRSVLRPVLFIAPEDKEYWFCNCKQTNHRPFCDGSHKQPHVQEAVKT